MGRPSKSQMAARSRWAAMKSTNGLESSDEPAQVQSELSENAGDGVVRGLESFVPSANGKFDSTSQADSIDIPRRSTRNPHIRRSMKGRLNPVSKSSRAPSRVEKRTNGQRPLKTTKLPRPDSYELGLSPEMVNVNRQLASQLGQEFQMSPLRKERKRPRPENELEQEEDLLMDLGPVPRKQQKSETPPPQEHSFDIPANIEVDIPDAEAASKQAEEGAALVQSLIVGQDESHPDANESDNLENGHIDDKDEEPVERSEQNFERPLKASLPRGRPIKPNSPRNTQSPAANAMLQTMQDSEQAEPKKSIGRSEKTHKMTSLAHKLRNRSSRAMPMIDNVRLSEMKFPLLDDKGEDNSREHEVEDALARRKQPQIQTRRETSPPATKKLRQKKRYKADVQNEPGADTSEHERHDPKRMFGQWSALRKAFAAVEHLGANISREDGRVISRNNIMLEDEAVSEIYGLCERAIELLEIFDHDHAAYGPLQESLGEIYENVDRLCNPDAEARADEVRSTDIYAHLIPQLVVLLENMIATFAAADHSRSTPEETISQTHLKDVMRLIRFILSIGAAVNEYVRPTSNLSIVRPVENGILVPLRDVDKGLKDWLVRRRIREENAARAVREEEAEAQRLLHEQEEETRRLEVRNLRNKWIALHEERNFADGPLKSLNKQKHLRCPKAEPESDQNGETFERLEMFGRRVGPPPALIERARRLHWSDLEVEALCHGLQVFQGPLIFERIFRRYCPRGEPLNKYNVTEIVTKAADIKEDLIGSDIIDDWVMTIPVWTKPHVLSGKENDVDSND